MTLFLLSVDYVYFCPSLNAIVELCGDERAGVLKPHLAQMMSALLDSLSDTEASVLNYASIRAGEGSQIQTAVSMVFTHFHKIQIDQNDQTDFQSSLYVPVIFEKIFPI